MRFYFTEEDQLTSERAAPLRAALVHAHHEVIHGRVGEPAPGGIDVWMYGMARLGPSLAANGIARALLDSPAELVLFQLCDAESLSFDRIPDALAARTHSFLRNHWPADSLRIPDAVQGRIGWLPPMLSTERPRAGKPLSQRSGGAMFFGSCTGKLNLDERRNAREETVRRMRASGLHFTGGIVAHADVRLAPAPELLVPRIDPRAHRRALADSKICLAPWGNHPLTYRFSEGMALRCLVLAQSLRDTKFLDAGLLPGRHYVELQPDLSDLTERVGYYLTHLDEAQRIADAGHAHYQRYFAPRRRLPSRWLFDASTASWGELYRPATSRSPASFARSIATQIVPRRFWLP